MAIDRGGLSNGSGSVVSTLLQDYSERINALGNKTGAVTCDLNLGNVCSMTLTGNVTLTFSGELASNRAHPLTLIITQDGTGGRTITFPASVKWPGNVEPTFDTTAANLIVLKFVTYDAGTTWRSVQTFDYATGGVGQPFSAGDVTIADPLLLNAGIQINGNATPGSWPPDTSFVDTYLTVTTDAVQGAGILLGHLNGDTTDGRLIARYTNASGGLIQSMKSGVTANLQLGANTLLLAANETVLGTSGSADPSALLTMNSTTRGFLPPRMTTAQRDAISTPPSGLLIYNTTTNTYDYYNGAWVSLSTGGGSNGILGYASAYITHNETILASSTEEILWDVANQSSGLTIWDSAGDKSRFTVPASWNGKVVRVEGVANWTGSNFDHGCRILWNGSSTYAGGTAETYDDTTSDGSYQYCSTGYLTVATGDYFQFQVQNDDLGAATIRRNTTTTSITRFAIICYDM